LIAFSIVGAAMREGRVILATENMNLKKMWVVVSTKINIRKDLATYDWL
jgi:hypothetical protein